MPRRKIMDAKVADQERVGSKIKKKKPDRWKLPKIPIDHVYNTKALRIFPSYVIKDFEETLTLDSTKQDIRSKTFSLVNKDFINSFRKKQHKFLHLGLVQVAIKPLTRVGLGAPIIVCLRDYRLRDFKDSLLAMVETDLSNGPFYFNCFPSFSVSYSDKANSHILIISVKTSGIPLALTYRTVCKAMVDLNSEALEELTLGKTTYFQLNCGSPETTKWDEVQVPEEWTTPRG